MYKKIMQHHLMTHPVWSKVIASIFIGFGVGLWSFFNWNKTIFFLNSTYDSFINMNVPLYYLVLILLGIILISWIISKVAFTKSKNKKDHFIGDNYRYTFTDKQILCRYSVGVSSYSGKPFIHNLKIYCNIHTPALEFYNGGCPYNKCINNELNVDNFQIERFLEADIVHRWEQFDENQ